MQGTVLGFKAPKSADDSTTTSPSWVLFSNPANGSLRMKMSIRLSQDGCQSWSTPWRIRWFASGYSDMTQYQSSSNDDAVAANGDNDDGSNPSFAILFENGIVRSYASVTFRTFTLQDVLNGVS